MHTHLSPSQTLIHRSQIPIRRFQPFNLRLEPLIPLFQLPVPFRQLVALHLHADPLVCALSEPYDEALHLFRGGLEFVLELENVGADGGVRGGDHGRAGSGGRRGDDGCWTV